MNDILKTDLYQITMMAAQFYKKIDNKIITCEAFARKLPIERKFFIMSGTEEIRNFLLNLSFSDDDIKQLKEISVLKHIFSSSNFETYLKDFRFTGDFWAMAEGEIVFPGEPLIRITAPISQANMVETFILSVLNHDIKIASKAARIVLASKGKDVLEFGTRRTHHEAAISCSRAAYLAGFTATSNVYASIKYGIPVAGTMSHMWVMSQESEEVAFQLFKDVYNNPIFLIDTYDTLKGAEVASKIPFVSGVRLDSGDFNTLSRQVRNILDNNGCNKVKIIVSGDLDEYKIHSLSNGVIDVFAVGTEVVSSSDVSSLGIVYKAVYDNERNKPIIKMASGKQSLPGVKQVYLDELSNELLHLIALENSIIDSIYLTPLLDCHIKDGNLQEENVVDLNVSRKYCNAGLLNLKPNFSSLNVEQIKVPIKIHESLERLLSEALNDRLAMG